MEEVLERLINQEKEISLVGTTVVQTEQLLRDLEMLDNRAEVTKSRSTTRLQFEMREEKKHHVCF